MGLCLDFRPQLPINLFVENVGRVDCIEIDSETQHPVLRVTVEYGPEGCKIPDTKPNTATEISNHLPGHLGEIQILKTLFSLCMTSYMGIEE